MSTNSTSEVIASRRTLPHPPASHSAQVAESNGGVIGVACSERIPGRHLLQSLVQMRHRGNGKGGGVAAVGLHPGEMGVSQAVLANDYLLTVAYLDEDARAAVERDYVEATFDIHHGRQLPHMPDHGAPEVYQYFARVRPDVLQAFRAQHGLASLPNTSIEDEIVYQNAYRLNNAYCITGEETRAFVLSHGKNMFVLKMPGYGDDVIRHYRLEDAHAHIWIGHHSALPNGTVWCPGGAPPFTSVHEALVHNGDFANYAGVSQYLARHNTHPQFLTNAEASALVFDLLHRTYGHPLEHVIEALAPTTARDLALLPANKQETYQAIQQAHAHSAPDGPWSFLVAHSQPAQNQTPPVYRLFGITGASALKSQVFALQQGNEVSVGFAASEKQSIDAVLASLAAADRRFWPHADRYWHARGGSHPDGGAFIFEVTPAGSGSAQMTCTDKFGRPVAIDEPRTPCLTTPRLPAAMTGVPQPAQASELFDWAARQMPGWRYDDVRAFLAALEQDEARGRALDTLTMLMDRRYPTGAMRRSCLLALYDQTLDNIVQSIRRRPDADYIFGEAGNLPTTPAKPHPTLVIDARGFPPQGIDSVAMALATLYRRGFRRFIVAHTRGHRFIGNGLGPDTGGVRIDVYGSPGDYLGSGVNGAAIYVHRSAQDHLAQIMRAGKLVIYGDVGQSFGYAALGGEAYVLGSTAGRPLANAAGQPRVVINGTCTNHLAESFAAGDPHDGGGFAVLNGIAFDDDGQVIELDTPYPGEHLFSMASGGAVYLRDPHRRVTEDQLDGGAFDHFDDQDWALIRPYLEENARLFGVSIDRLLTVNGKQWHPASVYRKVALCAGRALQTEEAWAKKEQSVS